MDIPEGYEVIGQEPDIPEGYEVIGSEMPEGYEVLGSGTGDSIVDNAMEDSGPDFFSQRTVTKLGASLDKSIGDVVKGTAGIVASAVKDEMEPEWIGAMQKWGNQFKGPDPEMGSSGIIEDAIIGMSGFAVPMIATAINAPLGFGMTVASLYGDKVEQLKAEGKPKEVAEGAAYLHALTSAPIEMMGNLIGIGAFKKVAGAMGVGKTGMGRLQTLASKYLDFLKTRTGRIAGAFAAGATGEGGEELAQAYTEALADTFANNPDDSAGQIWKKWKEYIATPEFEKMAWESAKVGAVGGMLLPGASAVFNLPGTAMSYFEQKRDEVYKKIGLTDLEKNQANKSPSDMKKAKDLNAQFEDKETVKTATSGETLTKEDTSIVEKTVATGAEYEDTAKVKGGKTVLKLAPSEAIKSGVSLEQHEEAKEKKELANERIRLQQENQRQMDRQAALDEKSEQEAAANRESQRQQSQKEYEATAEKNQFQNFMDFINSDVKGSKTNQTESGALTASTKIVFGLKAKGKTAAANSVSTATKQLVSQSDNLGTLRLARFNLRHVNMESSDKYSQALALRLEELLSERIDEVTELKAAEEKASGAKDTSAKVTPKTSKGKIETSATTKVEKKLYDRKLQTSIETGKPKTASRQITAATEKAQTGAKALAEKARLAKETKQAEEATFSEARSLAVEAKLKAKKEAVGALKAEALVETKKKVAKAKKIPKPTTKPTLKVADIDSVASIMLKRKEELRKAKDKQERSTIIEKYKPLLRNLKTKGKLKYQLRRSDPEVDKLIETPYEKLSTTQKMQIKFNGFVRKSYAVKHGLDEKALKQQKAVKSTKPVYYTESYTVEGTGQVVSVKRNAHKALAEVENDLFASKVIRDCL